MNGFPAENEAGLLPENTLSEAELPWFLPVARLMAASTKIYFSACPKRNVSNQITIGSVAPEEGSTWCQKEGAIGFHIGFQCGDDHDMKNLTRCSALLASSGTTSPIVLDIGTEQDLWCRHGPWHFASLARLKIPPAILSSLPTITEITIRFNIQAQALVDLLTEGDHICPSLERLDYSGTDEIRHVPMAKFIERRGGEVGNRIWRRGDGVIDGVVRQDIRKDGVVGV